MSLTRTKIESVKKMLSKKFDIKSKLVMLFEDPETKLLSEGIFDDGKEYKSIEEYIIRNGIADNSRIVLFQVYQ